MTNFTDKIIISGCGGSHSEQAAAALRGAVESKFSNTTPTTAAKETTVETFKIKEGLLQKKGNRVFFRPIVNIVSLATFTTLAKKIQAILTGIAISLDHYKQIISFDLGSLTFDKVTLLFECASQNGVFAKIIKNALCKKASFEETKKKAYAMVREFKDIEPYTEEGETPFRIQAGNFKAALLLDGFLTKKSFTDIQKFFDIVKGSLTIEQKRIIAKVVKSLKVRSALSLK